MSFIKSQYLLCFARGTIPPLESGIAGPNEDDIVPKPNLESYAWIDELKLELQLPLMPSRPNLAFGYSSSQV